MSCPSCRRRILLGPIVCTVHQRLECAVCVDIHERELD
jgi:hypothetical protein